MQHARMYMVLVGTSSTVASMKIHIIKDMFQANVYIEMCSKHAVYYTANIVALLCNYKQITVCSTTVSQCLHYPRS